MPFSANRLIALSLAFIFSVAAAFRSDRPCSCRITTLTKHNRLRWCFSLPRSKAETAVTTSTRMPLCWQHQWQKNEQKNDGFVHVQAVIFKYFTMHLILYTGDQVYPLEFSEHKVWSRPISVSAMQWWAGYIIEMSHVFVEAKIINADLITLTM